MKEKRTIWDRVYTYKVYAMRCYTSLVGWIITLGTFAMVSYEHLLLLFPGLLIIFPNVFVFMAISMPIGLLLFVFIGRWDWKRGTFPKEGAIAFSNNPEWVMHRTEDRQHAEKTERHLFQMQEQLNDIERAILKIAGEKKNE